MNAELAIQNRVSAFRRKITHNRFQALLQDRMLRPLREMQYLLEVDGRYYRGKTDAEGYTEEHLIPASSKRVRVVTANGKSLEEFLYFVTPQARAAVSGK